MLGSFELSDGTHRHHKLGTRAAMALLARLGLQPDRSHPREALTELLWPGVAPDAGRQRLRQTLTTLRQVLEPPGTVGQPVLDADRLGVRLVPGSVECDALAFERACRAGDLQQAHALYRGELLPGHYDEWINDERLRLEGLFERLPPLPAIGPAAGTVTAAAATSAVPGTEAPRAAGPGPLPAYLSRLVGAEGQSARLVDEVAQHRLVTVLGPGGAGKTRLAVAVAQHLTTDARTVGAGGFDFIGFVPLAACHGAEQLQAQLLLSLRFGQGRDDPLGPLVGALTDRRALLVLDNAEQVVEATARLVADLSARLPQLHLLVTSRRALGLPGEREWPIEFLPLPAPESPLAALHENPAVALFVDRARAARSDFHLHEGNAETVAALVRRLDGMPLAIELAAARVRSLPPAQMLRMLDGSASTLDLLARPRPQDRQASMASTIDWSWRLLAPAEQALASALTVFGGSFSGAAAAAVCADGPEGDAVLLALDELCAQSMLRAWPQPDGLARYALLEPIRDYASRALSPALARQLRQRHRRWWHARGAALGRDEPLTAMREDLPDLAAALHSADTDGVPDEALRIVLALWQQPTFLQYLDLPARTLTLLLALADRCGDARLQGEAQTLLARLLYNTGRSAEALQRAQAGLAAAHGAGPAVEAEALSTWLAFQLREQPGDPALGPSAERSLALAREAGREDLLARVERTCGLVALGPQRDAVRAEQLIRQALARSEAVQDAHMVSRLQYDLAHVAFRQRAFDRSLAHAAQAAEAAAALDNRLLVSMAIHLRGHALLALRRWDGAAEALREAALIGWAQAVPVNWLPPLRLLARALVHRRQPRLALQLAAFAAAYRELRLGGLDAIHRQELRRVRKLAAVQLGTGAADATWAEGGALRPAAAFRLLEADAFLTIA